MHPTECLVMRTEREEDFWERLFNFLVEKSDGEASRRLAGISLKLFNPFGYMGNTTLNPNCQAMDAILDEMRKQCRGKTRGQIEAFVEKQKVNSDLVKFLNEILDKIELMERRIPQESSGRYKKNLAPNKDGIYMGHDAEQMVTATTVKGETFKVSREQYRDMRRRGEIKEEGE